MMQEGSNLDLHAKLYRKPSDGSGAPELLLSDDEWAIASDWSRDGKYLVYFLSLIHI